MKQVIIYVLFLAALFCGCGYTQEELDNAYAEGYNNGYTSAQCELSDDTEAELSDDSEVECDEDELNYYINLCDYYGYLSYDMVYSPELWCNYFVEDEYIYHRYWLCPDLDQESIDFISSNPDFKVEHDGYSVCSKCSNTVLYFLDPNEGVVHSKKSHLNLGTEDFVNANVNYRFVGIDNAQLHDYTLCPECDFEN